MPDPVLSFCHHLIPLLPQSGVAGGSGGKVHLPTVKAACKQAERVHAVIKMAGRFELAAIPDAPDFFDPTLVDSKARQHAWETIRETPRLLWLIPTRRPDLITSSLPPTWIGRGFQNVCIGYMADTAAGFAENLQALRTAPLQHRMLCLSPGSLPNNLQDHLQGIDWVVLDGNPSVAGLAETVGAACRKVGASFLFLRPDASLENVTVIGGSGNDTPLPSHPFGTRIDLSRPTLPKLMLASPASEIAISSARPRPSSPSPVTHVMKTNGGDIQPDHPPAPEAEAVHFEIVNSGNNHPLPAPSASPVSATDHDDFARFDGIVRRGMATFIEVGLALAQIRDRELWRAGGHSSWAEYCRMIGGLSKTHANRIIASARVSSHIAEVAPIGVTPGNEAQARQLTRLKQPDQQILAWTRAVERANGQPTAGMLSEVVAELMAGESPSEGSGLSPKQRKLEAFNRLRDAFHAKRPRKEIERLLTELEKHLQSP